MDPRKIFRILRYIIDAYEYAKVQGLFESRMTDNGPELGVTIFISHAQAAFIRKTAADIKPVDDQSLPYVNPLQNPPPLRERPKVQ